MEPSLTGPLHILTSGLPLCLRPTSRWQPTNTFIVGCDFFQRTFPMLRLSNTGLTMHISRRVISPQMQTHSVGLLSICIHKRQPPTAQVGSAEASRLVFYATLPVR